MAAATKTSGPLSGAGGGLAAGTFVPKYDGVRSIFFYNSEAEVGQQVGLHLFEPRYRLMSQRAMMDASRCQQVIFLPNYRDYIGAHGDVGILATITNYQPIPVRNELPRANVQLRFDARVMVLWHWVEPGTGALHECTYRTLPGSTNLESTALETLRELLFTSDDNRYELRMPDSAPEDLHTAKVLRVYSAAPASDNAAPDEGDCIDRLDQGDVVTMLQRRGDWMEHSRGWSLWRNSVEVWLHPKQSSARLIAQKAGAEFVICSENAPQQHVLVHGSSVDAAAAAGMALCNLGSVSPATTVAVHVHAAANTLAVSELLERIAALWRRDAPLGPNAAVLCALPQEELRTALYKAACSEVLREDISDDEVHALARALTLNTAAAQAASEALVGMEVCTAFGCPCFMSIAKCSLALRTVHQVGEREADDTRPLHPIDLLMVQPPPDESGSEWGWGSVLAFHHSQPTSLDRYVEHQYQWEQENLSSCPSLSKAPPPGISIAHAAKLSLHSSVDASALAELPTRYGSVLRSAGERCILKFLTKVNWWRVRLLWIGQKEPKCPFSSFDGDLLNMIVALVLTE